MRRQNFFQLFIILIAAALLAACSSAPDAPIICTPNGKCTIAPKRATSRPYQINGIWYYPQSHYEYEEVGIASYYGGGDSFHGRPTATGKIFDMNGVTAAHKTLPLPCIAEVTNLENGRQIQLEVNDRGPFVGDRIIDVSRRAAQLLGFERNGTARVKVRTLVAESLALNAIEPPNVMYAEATSPPAKVILASSEIALSSSRKTSAMIKEHPRLPESLFEEQEEVSFEESEAAVVLAKMSPPAPSPRKEEVKASTGIFVQIGGYESQGEALALSKKLKGFGDSLPRPVKNLGAKPYAVQLGPLLSMAHANQVLDQLVSAGHLMARIVIHR